MEMITTKDLRVGDVIQDVASEEDASVFKVDKITETNVYLKPIRNCIGYYLDAHGLILFPNNTNLTWYRHG